MKLAALWLGVGSIGSGGIVLNPYPTGLWKSFAWGLPVTRTIPRGASSEWS
jgi:hypothetical protein